MSDLAAAIWPLVFGITIAKTRLTDRDVADLIYHLVVRSRLDDSDLDTQDSRREWARCELERLGKTIDQHKSLPIDAPSPRALSAWDSIQLVRHQFGLHWLRLPAERKRDRNALLDAFTQVLAIYAPRTGSFVVSLTDFLESRLRNRPLTTVIHGHSAHKDRALNRNTVIKLAEKISDAVCGGAAERNEDPMRALKRDAKRRHKD